MAASVAWVQSSKPHDFVQAGRALASAGALLLTGLIHPILSLVMQRELWRDFADLSDLAYAALPATNVPQNGAKPRKDLTVVRNSASARLTPQATKRVVCAL